MAKIINEWPTATRTRTSKYPWTEWLDGEMRELVEGVDYETSTISMQAQVGSAAKRLGVRYRTTTNEVGVAVQAILDWRDEAQAETGWVPRND